MPNIEEKLKQEIDERFVWTHSPEGRGYLYDKIGEQSVDEVIMKDFILSCLPFLRSQIIDEIRAIVPEEKDLMCETHYDAGYNHCRSQFLISLDKYKKQV